MTQVLVLVLDIAAHMLLNSLYGISVAQAVFYYRTYPEDNRILKSLVSRLKDNHVPVEIPTQNAIGRHSYVRQ